MGDGDTCDDVGSDRLETVKDHLLQKSKGKCPMCNEEKWYIDDDIYAAMGVTEKGVRLGGRHLPMMATVCRNCGFVAWFSAVAVGVLAPEEEEGEGGKP